MKPTISIITAYYNAESYISETIQSVINQTYKDFELIIVDDCSTDNGIDIIRQFQDCDSRIKLIFLSHNQGSGAARNEGIKHAKGKYITFLDSDDIYYPSYCKEQLSFIQSIDGHFVYASYNFINEQGKEILTPFIVKGKVNYKKLLYKNVIGSPTGFYNADELGKFYFLTSLRTREDFHYWLQILKKVDYAYANSKILASYRIVSNSKTSNKRKLIKFQFQFYHKIERVGLLRSIIYTISWGLSGLKKYFFNYKKTNSN